MVEKKIVIKNGTEVIAPNGELAVVESYDKASDIALIRVNGVAMSAMISDCEVLVKDDKAK